MVDYGYQNATGTISGMHDAGMYASKLSDGPTEVGPFGAAAMAFEAARVLVNRITALADHLCGPVPTPVSNSGVNAGSPAILPALRIGSEQTREMIREAHSALERIERSLS